MVGIGIAPKRSGFKVGLEGEESLVADTGAPSEVDGVLVPPSEMDGDGVFL